MNEKRYRIVYAFLLTAVTGLVGQNVGAAGFYIAEVGTPSSLGTGGVANPTNTYGADSSWTNPAGMTGLELARELRSFAPELPLILLSGLPSEPLRDEAREEGIGELLWKPVDIDTLGNAIRRSLGESRGSG